MEQKVGIAQASRRARQENASEVSGIAQGEGARTMEGSSEFGGPVGGGMTAAAGAAKVDSASDARTVNNVMRHEYRVLSDLEKQQMKEIKDAGADFIAMLEDIGGNPAAPGDPPRMASRELSVAMTKMEEAVMWAVKHITR
jgi:hypothetical protein